VGSKVARRHTADCFLPTEEKKGDGEEEEKCAEKDDPKNFVKTGEGGKIDAANLEKMDEKAVGENVDDLLEKKVQFV
jgi:hypothetical protein